MTTEKDENLVEEARKSLQKLTDIFNKTFEELVEKSQDHTRTLLQLNKSVSEFNQIQRKFKKREIEVKVKVNSLKTELFVVGNKSKLLVSEEDVKLLKSLKIKI